MCVNDIFTDLNECGLGLDSCDENSDCINTEGSYECRGLSETLKHILAEVNIRVVHQPHITLRRELVHVKDPVPPEKASGLVYSISCRECSDTYIGQTGRLLGTRLAEHRAAVKYAKTDVSAVAEHVWERQHSMDFDGTTILAREHDVHRRCLLESWFIQRSSTINPEVGPLPQLYRCLFCFSSFVSYIFFISIFLLSCFIYLSFICHLLIYLLFFNSSCPVNVVAFIVAWTALTVVALP